MEGLIRVPYERSFFEEVALTMLISFLAIEALSLLGFSSSPLRSLPYPIGVGAEILVIAASILGGYGLLSRSRTVLQLSVIPPILEVFTSLYRLFLKPMSSLVSFEALPPLILIFMGASTLYCLTKGLQERVSDRYASLDSETESENLYAVELENLTKVYEVGPVKVPAINGITMKVRRGEFVAIMGPSGCGKSTLLNLIGALDKPTSGRVLIDGVDISLLDEDERAQLRNEKIGFIFQFYNLINRSTVLRNVELPALMLNLPRKKRVERVKKLLEVVDLSELINRKPKTLSGGQQQRVAIARALMNQPKVILADEPTGNLDSKAGNEVMRFLRKLNKETGTTLIVVTHDKEIALTADRIIYLKDGRIMKEEVVEHEGD